MEKEIIASRSDWERWSALMYIGDLQDEEEEKPAGAVCDDNILLASVTFDDGASAQVRLLSEQHNYWMESSLTGKDGYVFPPEQDFDMPLDGAVHLTDPRINRSYTVRFAVDDE